MMMPFLIDAAEKGWIPDSLIRVAIRHLLRQRLKQDRYHATVGGKRTFVEAMREVPLAVATDEANEQHYEVPSEFFVSMLGPHLKYSSAWYPKAGSQLGEAEAAMLDVTMDRAAIEDGQSILELGCGWGSLTLAMAARFKNSQITAVSNSASQKAYIDGEASARGLGNISVITADMRSFEIDQTFDRVVSVEMFEHMRNYEELFRRIKGWLNPKGKLFFHIFCHRNQPYFFEDQGDGDWMARHFFTGGLMPSFDLPSHFQRDLSLEASWAVNGQHYAQTCAHWLENLDQHREPMLKALGRGQHPDAPRTQWQRWRMFVMACEALFAHGGGETWFVGHFLMAPKI